MPQSIDLAAARRIIFSAAGLLFPFEPRTEGVRAAIERLGAVQIDTISVVERAHHHVLWSRVPGYSLGMIARLEAEPRRIFEYWSHAAAYLPLDEYRYCLPRMARVKKDGHDWFRADPKAVDNVRNRIASEGPLRVQDFTEPMKGKRGWWDWKPAKVALEYLFHAGVLTCIGREGFQKVYDLAERALPADLDRSFPNEAEQAARHVDRAVASLGVFSPRDVAYMRKDGVRDIEKELTARVESGSLIPLEVEGMAEVTAHNTSLLASPMALAASTEDSTRRRSRALILSPFDPAIIDRKRAARLLGLQFQLECYVPEAKRVFGYFALPILYLGSSGGSGFVGLVDAKADRAVGFLEARRLAIFPQEALSWAGRRRPSSATLAAAIATELGRFAAFNGAERVKLGRVDTDDPCFKNALESALKKIDR